MSTLREEHAIYTHVVESELVVCDNDSPPLLEPFEEALDALAPLIDDAVVACWC